MKNYFCFCYLYLTDVLTCEREMTVISRRESTEDCSIINTGHWPPCTGPLCWQPPHPALTTTITIFSMSQTRTTNQHRLTSTPCCWLKKVLPFSWLIAFFFQFHILFFTGFCIISLIVTIVDLPPKYNNECQLMQVSQHYWCVWDRENY